MRTELWDNFNGLLGGQARLLGTVTAHNTDGTSSLTTYDGAQMRVVGQLSLAIPYNAWVRDGRMIEAAPNLPLMESEV
ncbi:hypothetical protein [Stenotrophomonas sp. PS02289]|uniref:hypothetical protein n=1 Tax=Stenotrophomonas sp. PS02289 TaxID=2991422 RepID=UPI00249B3CE8|nr:hypothetical protein [Stenotrophomonas sp. PS02289]